MLRKALLSLAVAGSVVGSTAAQAAVNPVPVNATRSDSVVKGEHMAGFAGGYGWLLLAAIAAAAVAVVVTDDSDSDSVPVSA